MNEFRYGNGELFAEGARLASLAERHGTPLFVYSRSHLNARYGGLADAMAGVSPLICYSVKANSNGAIIRTFSEMGCGADVVSGGELFRALRAGVAPSKIVFAGVGKTALEIEYALRERILFFTVESEPELDRISSIASKLGVTARVALRVNPDVDAGTHRHTTTGRKQNKFGIEIGRAGATCAAAGKLPGIELAGIHLHIGSQILSAEPFESALERVRDLCVEQKARQPGFKYIDIGGGLGIRYAPSDKELDAGAYAARLIPPLKDIGLSVVLEPGRYLVGNAGLLVCRVQYVKRNAGRTFVIVDAAMNDLIRPSLYGAYHEVVAVRETAGRVRGDLVGPVCESGDYIALDRELPAVEEGALLAIMGAGAYGFSMSSNYNSRPRAAEVMVDGAEAVLIRERETWEDLVAKER